jgi:hypothetical protein
MGSCVGDSVILALALIGLATVEAGAQEWAWAEADFDK